MFQCNTIVGKKLCIWLAYYKHLLNLLICNFRSTFFTVMQLGTNVHFCTLVYCFWVSVNSKCD